MRRHLFYLPIFLIYFGCEGQSKKSNEPKPTETVGELIYKKNCKVCHGKDGTKGLGGASDLSKTQLDQNGLLEVIKNGRGNMAPYGKVLSEKEIEELIQHIQLLSKDKSN